MKKRLFLSVTSEEDLENLVEKLENDGFAFTTDMDEAIMMKDRYPDLEIVRRDVRPGREFITEFSLRELEIAREGNLEVRGDPDFNRPESKEQAWPE